MGIIKRTVPFLVAFLLYFSLSWSGIRYGLPHENHLLSYNADETTWLEALSRLRPHEGKLNPHPWLAHPTLYLWVYGGTIAVLDKAGWISASQSKEWFRNNPHQFARLFLAGRILQIGCGFLLLIGMAFFAYRLYGYGTAVMSFCLLAVTPSLIGASHFSQANIPVTTLTFFSLGLMLLHEKDRTRYGKTFLRGAAFLAGLAVSTKYSAAPLALALLYWGWKSENRWQELLTLGVLGFVGFFIGTPFAVLAPESFWSGFRRMSALALEPRSNGLWDKLSFPFTHPLRHAMGTTLEIVSFLAFLWHLKSPQRSPTLLLTIAGLLLGITAAGYVASSARVLLLLPPLILLTAERLTLLGSHNRIAGRVSFFVLLSTTLLPSLSIATLHQREPHQKTVSRWIEENLPKSSSIGITRAVFWWTPPVIYVSAEHPERIENAYRVINLDFSIERAESLKPDYIVLSGAERTNDAPRYKGGPELLTWLDSGVAYSLVENFPREIGVGPWRWNRPEYHLYTDDDLWSPSFQIFKRITKPS
jgi:hypothetical protein